MSISCMVGAVGIEKYATSQKPRKQRRCSRSYRDNHYKHYNHIQPMNSRVTGALLPHSS